MKLKPEVKVAWLEALRSGRYQQAKGALHVKAIDGPDRFCCLGVLCELAVAAGVIEAGIPIGVEFAYGGERSTGGLPMAVSEWAAGRKDGLQFLTRVEINGTGRGLAHLNDHAGLNFIQIADLIEEQM